MLTRDVKDGLADFADELLRECRIHSPPVDPREIARVRGIEVVIESASPTPGRIRRAKRDSLIVLRAEPRAERTNWQLAHELVEMFQSRVSALLGGPLDAFDREAACNLAADYILLPPSWFREDARAVAFDLPALKAIYSTASNQLIAKHTVQSETTLVTVFDNGRKTARYNSPQARLHPLELRAQKLCSQAAEPIVVEQWPYRVQAWPIHDRETGWRREITRLTCDESATL